MQNKKTIISGIIIAVIAGIAISLLYSSSNQPVTLTKIDVGHVPVSSSLPTFVALENGYFKDAGFDVSVTSFQTSNQLAEAVATGQIDFGGAVSTAPILAISQKDPQTYKILADAVLEKQNPFTAILVKNDSNLALNDLPGKKIGIFPGSTSTILTRLSFADMFGADAKFEYVQMPPTLWLQALESGQVDAVLSYEPFGTLGVERGIAKSLYSGPYENHIMANDIPAAVMVVTSKFAKEHPEQVEKIERVLERAIDFIKSNESEARKISVKYMPIDENIALKSNFTAWHSAKNIDLQTLQQYSDILLKNGDLQTPVEVSSIVYGN
jgi:NitT/TauT family transport system substrate-binding protein